MVRKSRTVVGPDAKGYTFGVYDGHTQLTGTSETSDTISHAGYPEDLGGGGDIGGPWLLQRDEIVYNLGHIIGGKWVGSDTVISSGPGYQTHPAVPSDISLYPKGATAISRTIPTKPVFSGIQFLSEQMHDGIPMVVGAQTWRDRTKHAKNAGGEYLNVQFGWLPLVSDIRKFAHAVKNSNDVLKQLKAGSGHSTRVGYHFPDDESSSSGTSTCFLYKGGNTGNFVTVPCGWYRRQTTKTWFNGSFMYHLPVPSNAFGKAQLYAEYADKLLGVKPTPDAIWNAAPWTWALDWFTNAGDVITNISALHQNGLALEYGYLMVSTETVDVVGTSGAPPNWTPASRTRTRVFKKRIPAEPYGFGVTEAGLSLQQRAVLVALGLTHGKGGHG